MFTLSLSKSLHREADKHQGNPHIQIRLQQQLRNLLTTIANNAPAERWQSCVLSTDLDYDELVGLVHEATRASPGSISGAFRCCIACSKECARASNRGSDHAGPKNETPTGRPNRKPPGTVMCG